MMSVHGLLTEVDEWLQRRRRVWFVRWDEVKPGNEVKLLQEVPVGECVGSLGVAIPEEGNDIYRIPLPLDPQELYVEDNGPPYDPEPMEYMEFRRMIVDMDDGRAVVCWERTR